MATRVLIPAAAGRDFPLDLAALIERGGSKEER
jgi:hypothetical protein